MSPTVPADEATVGEGGAAGAGGEESTGGGPGDGEDTTGGGTDSTGGNGWTGGVEAGRRSVLPWNGKCLRVIIQAGGAIAGAEELGGDIN